MLREKLILVILLLSPIGSRSDNIAKYPLRVQLLRDHLAHDMIPTQLGRGTGVGTAVPQDAEVRTLGIAVVEGKAYNLVCESDASLDPGQYSGRWEKQEGKMTLLAPDFRNLSRLVRVTCKTSPYKGKEHFEHSETLPPGHTSPAPSPQSSTPPPAPPPMVLAPTAPPTVGR